MTNRTWAAVVAGSLLAFAAARAAAGDGDGRNGPPPTTRTDSVREFALPDLDGKARALSEFREAKLVVFSWTAPGCPIANVYAPRLAELAKAYAAKGVQFVGIDSNADESVDELKKSVAEAKTPFPILLDQDGALAERIGVTTTTAVAVLDGNRRVRYRGALDDQYGIGGRKPAPEHHYLVDALDALLAGRVVATESTPAPGCAITFRTVKSPTTALTWNHDLVSVVRSRCTACHRPGQVGPFSLQNFADVRSRSAMIKEVVSQGRMPPWHADAPRGKFENDTRLADDEKTALLSWIEGGAPEGDPKEAPPPPPDPTPADVWVMGKPDAVFKFAAPIKVPAEGVVPYRYVAVPTDFAEDRWVRASEVKAGATGVVHHVLVVAVPKGKTKGGEGAFNPIYGFFAAMVPGSRPVVYPDGLAKRLPKGSTLLFQMHYTPNGIPVDDVTSIGLIFAKEPPKPENEVFTAGVFNPGLRIPAGAPKWEVTGVLPVPFDAKILSYMPHMHLRGTAFRYEIVRLGRPQDTQVILSVPHYDFNWQSPYRLKEPQVVPRGSLLRAVGTYDNSDKNPYNPDPKAEVTWGDQTWDEMMIGYVDYIKAP